MILGSPKKLSNNDNFNFSSEFNSKTLFSILLNIPNYLAKS